MMNKLQDQNKEDDKQNISLKLVSKFRELCEQRDDSLDISLIKRMFTKVIKDEDKDLVIVYINEILYRKNNQITIAISEILLDNYKNSLFGIAYELIFKSRGDSAINIFTIYAIKKMQPIEIRDFINESVGKLKTESSKVQSAFVDSVINSYNIDALVTLLAKTHNIETAKEGVVITLYSYLKDISHLNKDICKGIMQDLYKILKTTLPSYSDDAMASFLEKLIKASAVRLKMSVEKEDKLSRFGEKWLGFLLITDEDKQLEDKLCSKAMVEMFYLHTLPKNKLTPSELVGINTRKKIARSL